MIALVLPFRRGGKGERSTEEAACTTEAHMFIYRLDDEVSLRLFEERDAPALFALTDANRAYLRQWLPWLDTTRVVEDTRMFIHAALRQYAENRGFQAGIWSRGDLAGSIGYHEIDWANRSVELGYWLGAAFQGHGVMTRACRALVTHALDDLGLNRVAIRCATGNTRSCAIPERLGFTREGILRKAERLYDQYVDLAVYSCLASEWSQSIDQRQHG